jgi:hypothetical protein
LTQITYDLFRADIVKDEGLLHSLFGLRAGVRCLSGTRHGAGSGSCTGTD